MNILQLSDPHLLANPEGRIAGRRPLPALKAGLREVLGRLADEGIAVDRLLLSGDLCDDESWGGYACLREALEPWSGPIDLLAGNHDHAQLLRAAMGRRARVSPGRVDLGPWQLLLLHSHRPGCVGGWLGPRQLQWLREELEAMARTPPRSALVAVHHPPLPIGDPALDAIALHDGAELLHCLAGFPQVRGLVFGHVHQHWQGSLPGRPSVPLLACPSTLRAFGPTQPCPLGHPHWPGGRLLLLGERGEIRHRLLRWPPLDSH
ncbi:MAG: metallophosphoesterase [Cyanobacteriota bacterium]|nr:metallophosphoesterase [Cyanobacteriota bacterium]